MRGCGKETPTNKRYFESIKLPNFLANLDPTIFRSDNYVVLDWETTNLDKGFAGTRGNRIVLGTWILGPNHPIVSNVSTRGKIRPPRAIGSRNGVHFKLGNEFEQGELVEAVLAADFIVAHFAKFELQWLVRAGVDISRILPWDTVLGEYVIAGNRRRPFDLDSVAKKRSLGTGKESLVAALIEGGVCPSEIPEQWLIEYGCLDTSLCHKIFLQQRKELELANLLPVMYTRCITTPVLADMELNGLTLDKGRVKEQYDIVCRERTEVAKELSELTGGINLNSTKQVGGYLYDHLGFKELTRNGKEDRNPGGGRRTDGDSIAKLRATTPEQIRFSEIFRKFGKLDYKLDVLTKFNQCCIDDDGALFASINQAVVQTHRLASSGKKYKAQIHNIERSFKKLFKARHTGWKVGEADGSQLEFRVAAHLGNDPVALADIRNPNFDAHYQTAEHIYGKPRSKVSKEERTDVKPDTFGPLYGKVRGTPGQTAYFDFFRKKYNTINSVQESWALTVLKTKKLITEWGLIFYWPDTKLENGNYIRNRTNIFNYPVQSLATAEIIPVALVYTWHYFKALNLQGFLVNTVHDSVIAELPPEEEEIFREICEYCFTTLVFEFLVRVYRIRFRSPLGTETKVGDHWSEGAERKYDLDPDDYFRGRVLQ